MVTGFACNATIATLRSGLCATCAELASRRQDESCFSMRFLIPWTLVITRFWPPNTHNPIWISKSLRTPTQSSSWGGINLEQQSPCNNQCLRWISMHSNQTRSISRKYSNSLLRSTSKYLRGLSNQLLCRPNLPLSSPKTSRWDQKTTQSLWISN